MPLRCPVLGEGTMRPDHWLMSELCVYFDAVGWVTGNDRSPKVDLLTGGTMRAAVADERRWRRPSTSATRQMLSARQDGAVPFRQRNVRKQFLTAGAG